MTKMHWQHVKRYEDRMRADGFVRKHVWVPTEKTDAFDEYVKALRTEHSGVRTPELKRLIANIRRYRPKLDAEGVIHLSIFGSYARGEQTPESDLDVVVEIKPGVRPSLGDISRLRRIIEKAVKLPVDIVQRKSLRGDLPRVVAKQEVRVF